MDETTHGDGDRAQRLRELTIARPGAKYFALTLRANRRGQPVWHAQTRFVGWSDRNPRWEMRQASLVDAVKMTQLWNSINQTWLVVHDDHAFALFVRRGGNALVERKFAEKRMPGVISPIESVHDGGVEVGGFGFLATGHMADQAIDRRTPNRTLRMRVLKRDNYRCVICGRRPGDHIDLELHVHHLIPWRIDGPTAEENLVTLCGTCHKGLVPDYEPMLRELAGLPGPARPIDDGNAEFDEDVARYREWVARQIAERQVTTDVGQ
ncbi:HNH endonuclease [Mycobacterium sp. BK086]|uniref:HNH endonuclease n=1 Tax=Mycobacterium sp. BK086 TaxID=2512165 RepID=UPI0010DF79BB|nr:HNH endonuclease signature motif containing protein [Mycobacterium sp. BK086]TDO06519.1 HNH endonuclease [Mycobacterium sp. BK086]